VILKKSFENFKLNQKVELQKQWRHKLRLI